jgi:hypothetical protein
VVVRKDRGEDGQRDDGRHRWAHSTAREAMDESGTPEEVRDGRKEEEAKGHDPRIDRRPARGAVRNVQQQQ